MRTPHSFDPRARHGYALMITLVFLTITLVTLASLMWWTSSNGKVTRQNELFTTAEAAAEAATEQVVATLDRDWTYGQTLQAASIYAALVPTQTNAWGNWPIQVQFSDGSGNNNQTGVIIVTQPIPTNQLGAQFANLSGYIQPCTITSTATTINQTYSVSATVREVVNAAIIPLFQFAIFYNLDMDVSPGQPMNIGGNVFCNANIWMWPYAAMVFSNNVDAAGWVTNHMQPYDQQSSSGYVAPTYNQAGQPVSRVDSLTLPIGTNNNPSYVESIINLVTNGMGAPNAQAYTTNGQMYLFNESDLIISNAAIGLAGTKGTNITIWFQDQGNSASYLTKLQPDVTNVVGTVTNKFFSFVTNVSFYDFRESDTVQAVQIDVSKFNTWLINTTATGGLNWNRTSYTDKGNGIRSIYVYNKVPSIASQLPAVRMINGAQLPSTTDPGGSGRTSSGLTVTTPQPIYIKGDYNIQTSAGTSSGADTTYTYPAALMADAITVLSSSWNDNNSAYLAGGSLGSRNASSTTINAAALEGIVQSTNSGGNHYSGGIENFMRLEEDWTGDTLTYNGSIVVMFPSIYATSFWQIPGNYYNPPTRHWGFDVNFTNPGKLPPLTPRFFRIIRASWTDY